MQSLKILFLAPCIPWPLDTGGKIRTYHLLRALARRHQVQLLTFRDNDTGTMEGLLELQQQGVNFELFEPPSLAGKLKNLTLGALGPLPITIRKYRSAAMQQRIVDLVRGGHVDLIHCDHLHLAPYGSKAPVPFVMDEHNVETVIWERFARDRTEPRHRRLIFAQQARLVRRLEARLAAEAGLVLICSETDVMALEELCGDARPRTRVVPNGVDVDYFSAPGPATQSGHLFFTGSMDWAPNENAVLAFLDEIWPAIQRRFTGLEFTVVGRRPSTRLRERAEARGASVTGTVPDVRPHMREALALVVPMRVGGGTRLKILEAFAAGVPVISTALGIEGISALPGTHYLRAETAQQFVDQIELLQQDPGLRQQQLEAAGELVRRRYSWDAIGEQLAAEYSKLFG